MSAFDGLTTVHAILRAAEVSFPKACKGCADIATLIEERLINGPHEMQELNGAWARATKMLDSVGMGIYMKAPGA